MTPKAALAYIEKQGIVPMAGKPAGKTKSLAETIAGAPIKGSWWGHPKGQEIFRLAGVVADSPDIVICKLVDGKVTFIHRRLWPALVRLAKEIGKTRLAQVRQEHTKTGAHKNVTVAFPKWVPKSVLAEAARMTEDEARALIPQGLGSIIDA